MENSFYLKWIKIIFLINTILILVLGCVTFPPHPPTPDELEREILSATPSWTTEVEEGSLWSSGRSDLLYSDVKARNVGDIVTISIVESAKASKNATTKTGRESGLEASWSGLFDAIAGRYSINGQEIGTSHKIDLANNFDGKGETTRSSYMSAYITARVIHVLPNGNLIIQGSRQVQVNNENQFIYIQGIIRPEDISSSNIILSTYIAEARIELNGQGPISDKQNPGWLAKIVDWVWPF